MKKQLLILAALLSFSQFACDSPKPSEYGTVTIGNPGSKITYESKLGVTLEYSELLHFEENLEQRFLQIDNRKLVTDDPDKLSILRVEALQAPADAKQEVQNLADLERFVSARFPTEDTRVQEGLANGAIGIEVIPQTEGDELRRNSFVLLQDKTLLEMSVVAYPTGQGTELVGQAYRGTSYGSGSDGLGGNGIELPEVPEEEELRRLRIVQIPIKFVFPANIRVPAGDYDVQLFAEQIQELDGAQFQNLTGGVSLQSNHQIIYNPAHDSNLDIEIDTEWLSPGEHYISEIYLQSFSSLSSIVLRAVPDLGFYQVFNPQNQVVEISEMPIIKFEVPVPIERDFHSPGSSESGF